MRAKELLPNEMCKCFSDICDGPLFFEGNRVKNSCWEREKVDIIDVIYFHACLWLSQIENDAK